MDTHTSTPRPEAAPGDDTGAEPAGHERLRIAGGKARDVYAKRRRYGRPGPKDAWSQPLRPRRRRAGRIPTPPSRLDDIWPPQTHPTDPPWTPPPGGDHPFVFSRPLVYDFDGEPIDLDDPAAAARRIVETERRKRVALTVLYRGGRLRLSTVCLGVDSSIDGGRTAPPELWETMLFVGGNEQATDFRWRYRSRNAAVAGHAQIVAALKAAYNAGRPVRRRRPAARPGPWRHDYPRRWR